MLGVSVTLTLGAHDSFALLFAYAASAAGVRLSGRAAALAVAAVTALAAATLALTDPEAALFWAITGTVVATGTLWLLIGGLLRSNRALLDARAELADRAVTEERLRFARDMHDLLGHDLSLIALKAELAGKLLPPGADQAAGEVADIRVLSRSALAQVREAVDGYRRPTLSSELAGARVALEAAGIELIVDGPSESLDPEIEPVLAWAVREGATNVIRHSGARRAEIRIKPGRDTTELEIADDGRGAPVSNGTGSRAGHGLRGLCERADAVGGTVQTAAGASGGFRLRVSLPTRAREPAA
jgi:two-component system, NarL family, sensor histidine kinase DesK